MSSIRRVVATMAAAMGLALTFLAFGATGALAAGPAVSVTGQAGVNVNVGGVVNVTVGGSPGAVQAPQAGNAAVNVNANVGGNGSPATANVSVGGANSPAASANVSVGGGSTGRDTVAVNAQVGGANPSGNVSPVSANVTVGGTSDRPTGLVNASLGLNTAGSSPAPPSPTVVTPTGGPTPVCPTPGSGCGGPLSSTTGQPVNPGPPSGNVVTANVAIGNRPAAQVDAHIATGLNGPLNASSAGTTNNGVTVQASAPTTAAVNLNPGVATTAAPAPSASVTGPAGITANANSGTELAGGVLAPKGTGAAVHNQTVAAAKVPGVVAVNGNLCVDGVVSVGGSGYTTGGHCEGSDAGTPGAPIQVTPVLGATLDGPAGTTVNAHSGTNVVGGVLDPRHGTGVAASNTTVANAMVPGIVSAAANLCLNGVVTVDGPGYNAGGHCEGGGAGTPGAPIQITPVLTGTLTGPDGITTTVNSGTNVVGGVLDPVHGTGVAVGNITTVGAKIPDIVTAAVGVCLTADASLGGDGYSSGTHCDGTAGPLPPIAPPNPILPVIPGIIPEPGLPVTPITPITPVGVIVPIAPLLPIDPNGPILPVTPISPNPPVTPIIPVGVIVPTNPTGPTPPVSPVTPTGPVNPVVPITPTGVVVPTNPSTPVFPAIPGPANPGITPVNLIPGTTATPNIVTTTTTAPSAPASGVVASNPPAAPAVGSAPNVSAPSGPGNGSTGASSTGNGLNTAPSAGAGTTLVLPKTGHAARPEASIWALSLIAPLIAAALLLLLGFALRRAPRLG